MAAAGGFADLRLTVCRGSRQSPIAAATGGALARDLLGRAYVNSSATIPAAISPEPKPIASLGVVTIVGRAARLRTSSFRTVEQMAHVRIPVPEPMAKTAKTSATVFLTIELNRHPARRQRTNEIAMLSTFQGAERNPPDSTAACSIGETASA